jgi:hypothetical protein
MTTIPTLKPITAKVKMPSTALRARLDAENSRVESLLARTFASAESGLQADLESADQDEQEAFAAIDRSQTARDEAFAAKADAVHRRQAARLALRRIRHLREMEFSGGSHCYG